MDSYSNCGVNGWSTDGPWLAIATVESTDGPRMAIATVASMVGHSNSSAYM